MTNPLFLLMIFLLGASPEASREEVAAAHLKPWRGCFAMKQVGGSEATIFQVGEACEEPLPPCSTFKIPHALIALETGVLKDEHEVLAWDKSPQFMPVWEHDHCLRTAIPNSVVWFFKQVAARIGEPRMQDWLDKLDYGNKDLSGGLTNFWLTSSLKITPLQQLDFMDRLYGSRLPFPEATMDLVRSLLVQSTTGNVFLSGKTGSSHINGKFVMGWFVGNASGPNGNWVFVTNVQGQDVHGGVARKISQAILRDLDLLPKVPLAPEMPRK